MNLLENLISQLQASRGRWAEVSEKSGVPYSTICKIAGRHNKDPRISNVQALLDYFASR